MELPFRAKDYVVVEYSTYLCVGVDGDDFLLCGRCANLNEFGNLYSLNKFVNVL